MTPNHIQSRVTNLGFKNLSHQQLTFPEIQILGKGMKYVPTPKPASNATLFEDFKSFTRTLRLREYTLVMTQIPHSILDFTYPAIGTLQQKTCLMN